ncbi:hypothetical protein E0H68_03345, partial [Rhizobium leguminosarum bv. viciae]
HGSHTVYIDVHIDRTSSSPHFSARRPSSDAYGLSDEEKRYPVLGIISAPLLVERIEKSYRAETHDL